MGHDNSSIGHSDNIGHGAGTTGTAAPTRHLRRLVAGVVAVASLAGVGLVALPAAVGSAGAVTTVARTDDTGNGSTTTVAERAGREGREGREGRTGRLAKLRKAIVTTSATAIGIPADELRTELRSGKSIAEVATAKGVEVGKVVDALVATASEKIDAAVQSGRISRERADRMKGRLEARFEQVVQRKRQR